MAKKVRSLKQALVPATLWKRGFAYVIDALIVAFAVGFPLNKVVKFEPESLNAAMSMFNNNPDLVSKILIVSLLSALLSILYWAVLEFKFKQSIGKYMMKIDVKSTTNNLTFGQCFIRNISKINSIILLFDALAIFMGRSHQRYLERVSKTEVVEKGWKI